MGDLFDFLIRYLIDSLQHSRHVPQKYRVLGYIVFLLLGMLIVLFPEHMLLLYRITN